MLKVYTPSGTPLIASSSGRCFLLLEELGLSYEPIFIDLKKGEHKSEEYLKINPNGKIPTLIDTEEDFILTESMAINHYLCEKYKPELLGTSLKERANISRLNYWIISEYQMPLVHLMIQSRFMSEDKRDPKQIETLMEKVNRVNKILDQELEGKNFLNGDTISVADINVAPVASACFMLNVDISELKNFSKWIGNMCSRDTFKKLSGR